MKKTQFVSVLLPVIALTASLLLILTIAVYSISRPVFAQSDSVSTTRHLEAGLDQAAGPSQSDALTANSEITRNGKILESGNILGSGNNLVLVDRSNQTTYQLDDQQIAHQFLNQTVKVTGVLDPASGTIRIRAMGPA